MGLFDVIGNVGGICQVFLSISGFFLAYYSEMDFDIKSINEMYDIKT